jgi:hypothetical protein
MLLATMLFAATRRKSTSLDADPVVILIIGAIVVGVILVWIVGYIVVSIIDWRRKKMLTSVAQTEYMRWLAQVNKDGGIMPCAAGLQLPENEACFFAENANLYEPRAVRVSRHSGFGARPMRGLGVFEGESRSESHDEWRKISTGIFYVTNKRILFAGDTQTREIKLSNVISLSADSQSLVVMSAKRQKPMNFSGLNGQIARDTISMILSA